MSSIRVSTAIRIALSGICLAGIVLAPRSARAGEVPHLLADVDREPASPASLDLTAQPSGFFTLGGRLLFSTVNRNSADEGILWSTDGAAAGTVQVSSSLCSNPCGGMTALGVWRGLGFLLTYPENGYPKLWRTDGTPAGTALLRNAIGEPQYYFDLFSSPELGAVYFTGYTNDRGYGLWVSDGTPAGTRELLGADGAPLPLASGFTVWKGKLYFIAFRSDGTAEHQESALWSTDGTVAGTRFVADFAGGSRLVATPSHLFFNAGANGEDLWVTDVAPGSAHRLLDLDPPLCSPPPDSECADPDVVSMFASGDALYFKAQRPGHGAEIWRSDGTEAGSRPAIELPPGVGPIGDLRRLGEKWIFSASPGGIWTADGDLAQAAPLTGCDGGACPAIAFFLASPGAGKWLFASDDPVHGVEPWVTDGTGPGTRLLADTCPGSCWGLSAEDLPGSAVPSPYGGIYLRTRDSSSESFSPDRGLWFTDGTPEGTRRVAESTEGVGFLNGLAWYGRVSPKAGSAELWRTDGALAGAKRAAVLRKLAAGSSSVLLPSLDGLRFLADEGGGIHRLWTSDGTPEGTSPLSDFELAPPRALGESFSARLGGLAFFDVIKEDASGAKTELWRSDGTPRGTRGILTLGPRSIYPISAVWGDRLLFSVIEARHGCSLWTSDGTAAGTRQILPALPGVRCPTVLASLNASQILFVARIETPRDPVAQIFISDGTVAGTRQITDLHGTRQPLDDVPVRLGDTIFFRIDNPDGSPELWRTDGTPAGTRRVDDLSAVSPPYAFQGALYFVAYSSAIGQGGLFRLPPHASPRLLESQFLADPPTIFAPAGDRLLFTGQDEERGIELWTTDGTPAGTRLVRDLRPGPGSSRPGGLTSAGDRVFFSADDGTHGRELWESDGTPEGTRMVADLAPGGYSSIPDPSTLAVSNGFLFFTADDGQTGIEPWALRLEP
ncbi:MAG TPA: ELWxxDGT repeat protein [Thermoanaerobaculia bacterium]|jgi:ELWxxDGT repeat protein